MGSSLLSASGVLREPPRCAARPWAWDMAVQRVRDVAVSVRCGWRWSLRDEARESGGRAQLESGMSWYVVVYARLVMLLDGGGGGGNLWSGQRWDVLGMTTDGAAASGSMDAGIGWSSRARPDKRSGQGQGLVMVRRVLGSGEVLTTSAPSTELIPYY